jgi:hypothetical protein
LDKRLSGLQSRSGRGSEEKNSQPLPGLEPPTIQLVSKLFLSTDEEHQELTKDSSAICVFYKPVLAVEDTQRGLKCGRMTVK